MIAHVDHGKTTLVDALLRQAGAFREGAELQDRVMDSMDLEREKGITILAKNTAVRYGDHKINIVDTPGHADFGGEVERALTMVDAVVLLVDASEGPLPQTRFVLRKALALELPVILVINKIDRPDARIAEVVDEVYELFLDLDADESAIDFPIVYTIAREGKATLDPDVPGTDMEPLFRTLLDTVPAPQHDPDHPMRAWVTNLDASPYVGRLAVCRVEHGTIRKGQAIAWCREDGSIESARVGTLTVTEALDQVDVDEAGPGELIGNVSIRVLPTERPDAWEVQGRGELQLAVLVETMRREGFELTIGKPEVLTQEIDGTLHEPTERLTVDVPEEHVGAVTQLLGARKATMENMSNHGTGWVRLDYVVPARALIGFRTEFLTETRGTGMLHHVFEGWTPWAGEIRTRDRGSVVADRTGQSTGYAIQSLQERTALYVAPGEQVYEGMVVGENSRNEDMDVNICREKAKTNIRTQSSDDTIRLTPPKVFSLEQALESIADDECVEVTPETIRIRKTVLDAGERARILKKQKHPRD